MMDLRERLELVREIEAVGRRLVEMGLIEMPSRPPAAARTAGVPAAGPDVPGDHLHHAGAGALAAGTGNGARPRRRRCRRCRKTFRLKLRGARKIYCSAKCRSRAGGQQRRERDQAREAEADRQTAASICEQNAREGYGNLNWGNGNAQDT